MAPPIHTYGPTCCLSHGVYSSSSSKDDEVPTIQAQYFYSSPLPIDDPLTAVPTPSSSEVKPIRYESRPFSSHDSNALEEAWLSLASHQDRKNHLKLKNHPLYPLIKAQAGRQAPVLTTSDTSFVKKIITDKKINKHDRNKEFFTNKDERKSPTKEGLREDVATCTCSTNLAASSQRNTSPASSSRMSASKAPTLVTGRPASSISAKPNIIMDSSANEPVTYTTNVTDSSKKTKVELPDSQKLDADGDPHLHCKCSRPIGLDFSLPACCSELEDGVGLMQESDGDPSLSDGESKQDMAQEVLNNAKKLLGEGTGGGSTGRKMALKKQDSGSGQSDNTDNFSQHLNDKPSVSITPIDKEFKNAKVRNKAFERPQKPGGKKNGKEHLSSDVDSNTNNSFALGSSETGITGFPFKRAPSRKGDLHTRKITPSPSRGTSANDSGLHDQSDDPDHSRTEPMDAAEAAHIYRCKGHKKPDDTRSIPVGISRLHLVKIPALQMMPIYWSPVHDIAAVTRGTWFYRDTMYPVEPPLANQLEIGYRELRPWSQTWSDELNSAIEVGAAGEEKISYRIWPKESEQMGIKNSSERKGIEVDPYCAARCFRGEVAAIGTVDLGQPDGKISQTTQITKRFPNSHVIYKDSRNAYILKPSLQPSEYYGRKPLAKLRKGVTVGIHVVRGFDWRTWENLHPSKKTNTTAKAEQAAAVAGEAAIGTRNTCAACYEQEERTPVTDLILVIHGIGQKLSERVESFHFTHAINAFRRSINVELGNDAVRHVCRKDLGGIMVLPVNWRSNLSFEDGGPLKDGDKSKEIAISDFTLKDITPDTIPTIRNLISDVMLDIPFYMSHHKPKMIEALITEANRVYRLWCQNNPKFHLEGRVHIIAHSLGSAMALDVLSKQPTSIKQIDLSSKKASMKQFDFDTKNLFFVGSPAGFFLLLNKGKLMPRKGRNKPGAQIGDDKERNVAGEAGLFGCLAVDNLYNVMHYNDPIAYRLNAAVDQLYASTLKNAQVPSATVGWLEAIGNAMRSFKPGGITTAELGVGELAKPSVPRLPSQLEMEVHDFTREELAEKKFYLLNDNGQIDYFLSSGGGPLEIQYLNMLSAHSSYWGSQDFVRMLVTEVGREPGKSNTLPNMKAMKLSHK